MQTFINMPFREKAFWACIFFFGYGLISSDSQQANTASIVSEIFFWVWILASLMTGERRSS